MCFMYIFECHHQVTCFKMLWCNIKTLYVKKGKLLRCKRSGRFFSPLMFYNNLWLYPTEIFMEGFCSFLTIQLFFCIKYATEATLWRKYWWLHRILFKGWYIIIMPLSHFICFVILMLLVYSNLTCYEHTCASTLFRIVVLAILHEWFDLHL